MNLINGFCMALADSVPGVSGGTIAFLLGFYDKFIGSLDDLFRGKMEQKKTALRFLVKIGCGWIVGFLLRQASYQAYLIAKYCNELFIHRIYNFCYTSSN